MSEPVESAASATPASTHYLVIHNDDTHSVLYVINMAREELKCDQYAAEWLAKQIDQKGKVAIGFSSLDAADKVRLKILKHQGRDTPLTISIGPLKVTIEETIELGTPILGFVADQLVQLSAAVETDKDDESYHAHQVALGCLLTILVSALLLLGAWRIF